MRNDRREITLNEADSIKDMILTERGLASEYCGGIRGAKRKETRAYLLTAFSEVATDLWTLYDLLRIIQKNED